MTDQKSTLDDFFPRVPPDPEVMPAARRLGMVVGGSLSQGLKVKLDRNALVEGMAVGRYVVVQGQTGRRFFNPGIRLRSRPRHRDRPADALRNP